MVRKIIKIDENKCNGCALCADSCHEGAIEMIDGKAKLTREDYCDGLGDCLPACPVGAITFEEREAEDYNEKAVEDAKKKKSESKIGCPGKMAKTIKREASSHSYTSKEKITNELINWPKQIKLMPFKAPYLDGAKLLIAADCTAYAYASFHRDFMASHVTVVGCPKLDSVDYSEKLTEIIKSNDIKSVKIVKMEVPCCSALEVSAKKALKESGKNIAWSVVTISTDGRILD